MNILVWTSFSHLKKFYPFLSSPPFPSDALAVMGTGWLFLAYNSQWARSWPHCSWWWCWVTSLQPPWEAHCLAPLSVSFEHLFLCHPFSVAFLMIALLTSSSYILSQGYYIQSHRLFTIELNWLLNFSTFNSCRHPESLSPLLSLPFNHIGITVWVSCLIFLFPNTYHSLITKVYQECLLNFS